MNLSAAGLSVAFAAGFVSFVSPCVLPLIPAYLSFVSGVSAPELGRRRARVTVATAAFVLGFSSVFALAGAGVGLLGAQFVDHRSALELVGGIVVVVMGLTMLAPRVGLLQREWRLPIGARPRGPVGSFAVGAAFAIGWSPCIGATLSSILAIAGTAGHAGTGAALLGAYSIGLGVPFLTTGLFLDAFVDASRAVRGHWLGISRTAGLITVVMGLLLASGRLTEITTRLAQ
ncbi:MAG TPA: cytochrome c biogenesis protein CcdA [Gaiellales bacterium]|nr:cytochrome c biogenesis protein CcdA [Gaiellales bacterium]